MAMKVGASGAMADINVTPFVDIVLVLLIIFMVITPLLSRTLDVAVPPKAEAEATEVATADQLILTVKTPVENPVIMINREELPGGLDEVEKRVEELMRGRREKVVFFQSQNEIPYDYVIKVMDRIRGGGAEKIGLITDENLDVTAGP
jgi:biopolymer transport protein ExbD